MYSCLGQFNRLCVVGGRFYVQKQLGKLSFIMMFPC